MPLSQSKMEHAGYTGCIIKSSFGDQIYGVGILVDYDIAASEFEIPVVLLRSLFLGKV